MKRLLKFQLRLTLNYLLVLLIALPAQAADRITYYHNDALGSPVAATSQTGQLLWRESYRPYGERLTVAPASANNHTWFTGKQEESALGISYFGARWYLPSAGRFLSRDPAPATAENIHSFNRYAYANNNPYKYVDPDGRDPVIGMTVGAVAGAVYGGLGAYHAGGSKSDIFFGAAFGALFGAGVGAIDPSLGVGTLAFIGGASAGGADLLGQMVAHDGSDKPLINPGSTIGAVAGGALGGAGSAVLAPFAAGTGLVSESVATGAITALTSGPGVFTTATGTHLGEAAHEKSNSPERKHEINP